MKLRKILLSLFAALALPILVIGQSSRISGFAPDYLHQEVLIFTYGDHFTKNLIPLDETVVDNEGRFSLNLNFDHLEFINLRIGWVNAQFYVEPGTTYTITFPEKPLDVPLNLTPACKVDVIFHDLAETDFNFLLSSLNKTVDDFYNSHQELLMKMMAPKTSKSEKDTAGSDTLIAANTDRYKFNFMIDTLRNQLYEMYGDIDHPDFNQHVQMVLADLESITGTDRKYLFEKYLKESSFTPYLPEYCHFLEIFYNKYFANHAQVFGGEDLGKALNESTSYVDLMATLGKDDFLISLDLRETVAVYAIFEVYKNRSLDKKKLIQLLDSISEKTSSGDVKNIAVSVKDKLTRCTVNYPAPGFELLDLNNELVNLDDFKGNYVLLEFTADWCKACKSESMQISKLAERYHSTIKTISIYLDDDFRSVQKQFANYNVPDHTILSANEDPFIKEKYNLLSVPQYFILNTDGNFSTSHVKKPSEGLERYLHKIQNKEQTKEKAKIKIGEK